MLAESVTSNGRIGSPTVGSNVDRRWGNGADWRQVTKIVIYIQIGPCEIALRIPILMGFSQGD
jgi:hypothetical protein